MSAGKTVGLGLMVIIGIPVMVLVLRFALLPVTAANIALDSAEGVAQKTLDPNNVIHNYEWFHDASRAVEARVNQVKAHRQIVAAEKDAQEGRNLRIELAGMQQSCRELVAQYNANSVKINRNIFKGKTAPAEFDPSICE